MRESFIFYRSFYESLKELKDEDKLLIYNAICEYSINQEELELKGISKAIFTLIKPQLDANNNRYENGKKGGRPITKNNQNKTKIKPNQNQNKTKPKPNDNVNDNENVNYNNKNKQKDFENFEENNDVDVVVVFWNNNFRAITPLEFEKINLWRKDFTDDLIIKALEICVEQDKRSYAYFNGVLKSWKLANVKTMNDIPQKKIKGKKEEPEWLSMDLEPKEREKVNGVFKPF